METNEAPLSQSNDDYLDYIHARDSITRQATCIIAADTISKRGFPHAKILPRFFPTPFNNFGHYYLFDYKLYLSIIHKVLVDLQSKGKVNYKAKAFLLSFLGAIITLPIIPPIVSVIVFLTIFFYVKRRTISRVESNFAEIRYDYISKLLKYDTSFFIPDIEFDQKFKESWVEKAVVEAKEVPIVVFFNNLHPFPGFGKLQIENTFICPPDDLKECNELDTKKIFELVTNEIKQRVEKSGIQDYNFGKIISVDSDSIYMDSGILNSDKTPMLKMDSTFSSNIPDERLSSRIYFVVQLLFPETLTAASFFIRFYKASNAASCQISVTTLGPPLDKIDLFIDRYNSYLDEKARSGFKFPRISLRNPFIRSEAKRQKLYKELESLDSRDKNRGKKFFEGHIDFKWLKRLDLFAVKSQRDKDFLKRFRKIVDESIYWPGGHRYPLNYRETHSLTFTDDFFGRPESISAVRTAYDQISKAVLDTFEDIGFDISEYKNEQGKYSINADKIDQLVVGEKISLSNKDNSSSMEKGQKSETPTTKK